MKKLFLLLFIFTLVTAGVMFVMSKVYDSKDLQAGYEEVEYTIQR